MQKRKLSPYRCLFSDTIIFLEKKTQVYSKFVMSLARCTSNIIFYLLQVHTSKLKWIFGKFATLIWRLQFTVNVTLRACLLRGTQKGEVTCGGSPHPSCKRDQIKMRDYMDRRACKQALNLSNDIGYGNALMTNFKQQTLAFPLWELLSDSCSSMSSGMLISLFQKKKWRTRIQLKLTLPVHKHLAMQIP